MSETFFHEASNQYVSYGQPFLASGISYPANWLECAFPEEVLAAGLVAVVTVGELHDSRFYDNTESKNGATWTITSTPKNLETLKESAIAEIKRLRQNSLDSIAKSAGVSDIYAENLSAAMAYKAGTGETTLMRDGSTATAYLTAIAAGMGYTVDAFADYVITENSASAAKAHEIEAEYVRLVYTYVPACTFEQVQTVVSDYSAYCQSRVHD